MYDIISAVSVLATVIVGFVILIALWKLTQWLNFRARARDVNPNTTAEPEIPKLNAGDLFSELKTVNDWCQLGLNLGLEMYELNNIQRDFHRSEQQMLQTLDLWLKRTPKASWVDVVSALRKMGEKRVAENILQSYIRGRGESKLMVRPVARIF